MNQHRGSCAAGPHGMLLHRSADHVLLSPQGAASSGRSSMQFSITDGAWTVLFVQPFLLLHGIFIWTRAHSCLLPAARDAASGWRPSRAQIACARENDFHEPIQAGRSDQPSEPKYLSSVFPKIRLSAPVPPPIRGAFRDRHGRWNGMRWTRSFAQDEAN